MLNPSLSSALFLAPAQATAAELNDRLSREVEALREEKLNLQVGVAVAVGGTVSRPHGSCLQGMGCCAANGIAAMQRQIVSELIQLRFENGSYLEASQCNGHTTAPRSHMSFTKTAPALMSCRLSAFCVHPALAAGDGV
jgi:hypothetical protein